MVINVGKKYLRQNSIMASFVVKLYCKHLLIYSVSHHCKQWVLYVVTFLWLPLWFLWPVHSSISWWRPYWISDRKISRFIAGGKMNRIRQLQTVTCKQS